MFFKIAGSILVITSSTYLGFYMGQKLIKRINELKELEYLGTLLENEIVYSHTPIPEAVYSISYRKSNNIEKLFYKISEKLYKDDPDSVYEAFQTGIDENIKEVNLEEDDIKQLLDLTKSLGNYDVEGCRKVFSIYKAGIKNKISEAENKKNKNLKMYRYLGFSIGAMAVIMII